MSDLEDELSGKRTWAFIWMEQQLRNGVEREDLIAALLQWVQKKAIADALVVVGQFFSRDATRTEFVRLQEVAAPIDGREAILEHTKFDVFHRTLV